MKEFLKDIFGTYFKPVFSFAIIFFIFAFIFFIMYTDLTEATQRFGDIILGVLLAKFGTTIDYWLGTTDREEKNEKTNSDESN